MSSVLANPMSLAHGSKLEEMAVSYNYFPDEKVISTLKTFNFQFTSKSQAPNKRKERSENDEAHNEDCYRTKRMTLTVRSKSERPDPQQHRKEAVEYVDNLSVDKFGRFPGCTPDFLAHLFSGEAKQSMLFFVEKAFEVSSSRYSSVDSKSSLSFLHEADRRGKQMAFMRALVDGYVQKKAAEYHGSIFPQLPDQQQQCSHQPASLDIPCSPLPVGTASTNKNDHDLPQRMLDVDGCDYAPHSLELSPSPVRIQKEKSVPSPVWLKKSVLDNGNDFVFDDDLECEMEDLFSLGATTTEEDADGVCCAAERKALPSNNKENVRSQSRSGPTMTCSSKTASHRKPLVSISANKLPRPHQHRAMDSNITPAVKTHGIAGLESYSCDSASWVANRCGLGLEEDSNLSTVFNLELFDDLEF